MQTWHPPRAHGPGVTLQVADFEEPGPDPSHGYNITYADGLHAGYDRKTDRISGAHVGFGRRVGDHDVVVWLLPDEVFVEVIGPNGPQTRRTAVSSHGSTWGSWIVRAAGPPGTAA